MSLNVNEKQVGGNHYRSGYQHWDLVLTHGLHYLLGCATKYITRSKVDRRQDLDKAKHYIEKMVDANRSKQVAIGCIPFPTRIDDVQFYARENRLSFREYEAILAIIMAKDAEDLEMAIEIVDKIIKELQVSF